MLCMLIRFYPKYVHTVVSKYHSYRKEMRTPGKKGWFQVCNRECARWTCSSTCGQIAGIVSHGQGCLKGSGARMGRLPWTKDDNRSIKKSFVTMLEGNVKYVKRNEFIMVKIQHPSFGVSWKANSSFPLLFRKRSKHLSCLCYVNGPSVNQTVHEGSFSLEVSSSK